MGVSKEGGQGGGHDPPVKGLAPHSAPNEFFFRNVTGGQLG